MNNEKIYDAWKENKRKVEIRENFTDEVMTQIRQYEQNKLKSLFNLHRLIELMSAHMLAKAGLILTAGVVGLIRVVLVVTLVLE